MSYQFIGRDPIKEAVRDALDRLATGEVPPSIESRNVDIKEEPGRRHQDGSIVPGQPHNERAAEYLAGELACLANTPDGGALICGIADDGHRIGTVLDAEWLRHRIYQLSDRRLTVDVAETRLDGVRLLVLQAPEAVEPVRWRGKVRWRVDSHCVEVDTNTWTSGRLHRIGYDWSAQPSGYEASEATAFALEIARRYLRESGDDRKAQDLAGAVDQDLLRRLNLLDGDGRLTNAGALLFVETPTAGLDYIRRDHPGGDSTLRVRRGGPLLEQLFEVERAADLANRSVQVPSGIARGQFKALPPAAAREAIVNGVVHRDWGVGDPTLVEHVGDTLTVSSPGGFIGGVSPKNIITHPSQPRYRSLAEVMATMRLAEREGIGVDRMVADMLSRGRRPPRIHEIPGPYVRVTLHGGDPDTRWLSFLASCVPRGVDRDVDFLLLLDHLVRNLWVDADRAAPVLQRRPWDAEEILERVWSTVRSEMQFAKVVELEGEPQDVVEGYERHFEAVLERIAGVPKEDPVAYRLSPGARFWLTGDPKPAEGVARDAFVLDWANARGRVSSAEVADMFDVAQNSAGKLLRRLERDAYLDPGRQNRRGRGFYYVPAD